MSTEHSAEEILESLTGFDEIAISQHFGKPVSDLVDDQSMLARALVFVVMRREPDKMNDDDARNAALTLSLKEVKAFFPDDSEESGKDSAASELSPATSLTSVS